MKRDLPAMAETTHDLLVIGGGVCGVCIARDAAMRGLSVALVERADFSHATSAASSKLIHGGLRYLKNFELGLVRESLRERRVWETIAPHLVYPLRFILPNYRRRESSKRWMLRAGLTLYDLLAFDRNRLEDDDRKIPGHRMLSADQARAQVPGLSSDGLLGAAEYWDCQMFSPERLALECAVDAAGHGARLANWAHVTSLQIDKRGGSPRVTGAIVEDRHGGATFELSAKIVVNATGPWADRLLDGLPGAPPPAIVRSKGIHIITRSLTGDTAVAFETRHGHFFILPWRGHSLIGTTDAIYRGDPDDFAVTDGDIAAFLTVINAGFPSAALTREDVIHFYGGLRPLVESAPGDDSYDASRRSEVVDHGEAGGPHGLLSALGGKWTTARAIAEQVVDRVANLTELGKRSPCRTGERPLPGGGFGTWAPFVDALLRQHATLDPDVVANLARNYGARARELIALGDSDGRLLAPLAAGRVDCGAQVVFAVRHEMARTLGDVVFRRTGLGTLGSPGTEALAAVADLMGAELGWDARERTQQVESVASSFAPEPN